MGGHLMNIKKIFCIILSVFLCLCETVNIFASGAYYLPDVTGEMSSHLYWADENDVLMTYEDIVKEGLKYLEDNADVSGDALKCYLLSYELLKKNNITDIIDLKYLKNLISKRINDAICKDIEKYGVEYVPVPSDFFAGTYLEFITPEIEQLIAAEKDILGNMQKEDGGFDITWQWYTEYPEFEQARNWWRPRITIDKLLFNGVK